MIFFTRIFRTRHATDRLVSRSCHKFLVLCFEKIFHCILATLFVTVYYAIMRLWHKLVLLFFFASISISSVFARGIAPRPSMDIMDISQSTITIGDEVSLSHNQLHRSHWHSHGHTHPSREVNESLPRLTDVDQNQPITVMTGAGFNASNSFKVQSLGCQLSDLPLA